MALDELYIFIRMQTVFYYRNCTDNFLGLREKELEGDKESVVIVGLSSKNPMTTI
jgi:hypothetical protein